MDFTKGNQMCYKEGRSLLTFLFSFLQWMLLPLSWLNRINFHPWIIVIVLLDSSVPTSLLWLRAYHLWWVPGKLKFHGWAVYFSLFLNRSSKAFLEDSLPLLLSFWGRRWDCNCCPISSPTVTKRTSHLGGTLFIVCSHPLDTLILPHYMPLEDVFQAQL